MITLFTPPRAFETTKTYGRNPAAGQFAGLGDSATEKNVVSSILDSITGGAAHLIGEVTGANAAKRAQQSAIDLATAQAQAQVATSQARSETFKALAPWVGLAVVGVGLVVAVAVLKK